MGAPLYRFARGTTAIVTLLAAGCFQLPPDRCLTNHGGCDPHAVCMPVTGNTVTCTCGPGFSGDGHTCAASCENVCDSQTSQCGCSAKASCVVDAAGGASCQCQQGFSGDGFSCAPVGQSSCGTMTCDRNATCSVDPSGNASCTCNVGFMGDGVSCRANTGIGAGCADSSAGLQSTCVSGLSCLPISALNMCTESCSQDADCSGPTINNLPAVCRGRLCFPSCDPFVAQACIRSDFVCSSSPLEAQTCLPDCRVQARSFCNDFFGYPFAQCDDNSGSCLDETSCGSAGPCPSSEACFGTTFDSAPESVCVIDCTSPVGTTCVENTDCQLGSCVSGVCQSCPFGTACDSQVTLTCQLAAVANYATCAAQVQCPTSPPNVCVQFTQPPIEGPPTASLCLQECTQSADCPAGQDCVLPMADGTTVCAIECTGSGCPTGTTCQALENVGDLCLPKVP